jgi:hypothetical protein
VQFFAAHEAQNINRSIEALSNFGRNYETLGKDKSTSSRSTGNELNDHGPFYRLQRSTTLIYHSGSHIPDRGLTGCLWSHNRI